MNSQLIERVAKAMWEETHTQNRPWRNMHDSDRGETGRYLDMARVAADVMEHASE